MADSDYVTLISSEGHKFILPRAAALGSDFIKRALASDFQESSTSTITLSDQRAEIVEKVGEYLLYKERYSGTKEDVPDFQDRVRPEIALELLMASDFLEC